MTIKLSDGVRNAMLDAIETYGGASVLFQVWGGGSIPADESAATTGNTKAVEMTLPSDWAAAASAGVKAKTGTWQGTAIAATTATFFRLCSNAGVPFMQGSLTQTGGGGDATIDNPVIAVGQVVSVTSFNVTAPHG